MTEFNTPSHYILADGSDSMDIIEKILGPEEFKGFLRGNAIKYLIRYKQKGGIEDLKKAMDYINRLLAVEEAEEKEREFIKKSRPLLYKDEEESGGHSHDIKIPPHRFFDKKDGDHSHDIKIPPHHNVEKNEGEDEECFVDPTNHDLIAEMEAMHSKCIKAQILHAMLLPEDATMRGKDGYDFFKMLVGVVGDMQKRADEAEELSKTEKS